MTSQKLVLQYVRRVQREVPYHDEDTYVPREIDEKIRARLFELTEGDDSLPSIKKALKQIGRPSQVGRFFRGVYRESAERVSGILLFNRTFMNFAGVALVLLTAFVVFRLYPLVEYVCYAVCAVSAVLAALYAELRFYKTRYMLATMLAPAFFLLYYPIRDTLKDVNKFGGSFWREFLSYRYHEVFIIIIVIAVFFTLTTAVLHAKQYAEKRTKRVTYAVTALLLAASLACFSVYALRLRDSYNSAALEQGKNLAEAYELYSGGGDIAAAESASSDADELMQKYAGIYIPSNKQTLGSCTELLNALSKADEGIDELITLYHPSYDPKKETEVSIAAVENEVAYVRKQIAAILNGELGEKPFQELLAHESSLYELNIELQASVSAFYNSWIYAEGNAK